MAVSEDFHAYIQDQLSDLDDVLTKKMFGGVGCFKEGLMFAMIDSKDRFRLRVDDVNRQAFEEHGMKPFYSNKMKKGMPYWEVPPEILEDKMALTLWAQIAFEAAQRSKE